MSNEKVFPTPNTTNNINREIPQTTTPPEALTVPDIALTLSPVALLFSWLIFFLILQKIRHVLDDKIAFSLNGVNKVPCRNCRFYSNNHYIRCAVQPSIVLTDAAKDCSEYVPKKW